MGVRGLGGRINKVICGALGMREGQGNYLSQGCETSVMQLLQGGFIPS